MKNFKWMDPDRCQIVLQDVKADDIEGNIHEVGTS